MDANGADAGPTRPRPVIMQSTRVQPAHGPDNDDHPVRIVHAPGEPVPVRAPACFNGCTKCEAAT
jgi:hypothetical protein